MADVRTQFGRFARAGAVILGSPWLFGANVVLIAAWLASGPLFDFSDTWQLMINTSTTIITYLAVFLIQNTQNRDAKAMQLKLDELILAVEGARNKLVHLEDLTDQELEQLHIQFKRVQALAKEKEGTDGTS